MTGLVLAAAEANGSLAFVMFLAGLGQNGVNPTGGVTTLDYAIFMTKFGDMTYADSLMKYRMTGVLLLLAITLGLTVTAMLLQRRFAKRYRGSMTNN